MKKTSGVIEGLSGKGLRFGIVVSRFNAAVSEKLLEGAEKTFGEKGVAAGGLKTVWVPGAFEIPIALLKLAKSRKFHALVALGAVIRGETPHFDYVCQGAATGVMRVSLDFGIPIAFGVLTTDNGEQAMERVGGKQGHKGVEAALVAIEMARLMMMKVKAKV